MEDEDFEIEVSPLCRSVEREGASVEIHIYRGGEEESWVLEIVDQQGTSTVWDDRFTTDKAALQEALSALELEGIGPFLTADEPKRLH
ncbi:MAG: hypothetical protein ABL904_25460 [Hyphomicrobiaceae bacterium]